MKHMVMAVADSKQWQMRARQCYRRAITQKREEYQQDNATRYRAYAKMLQLIGVIEKFDANQNAPVFIEPKEYRLLTADVIEQIEAQKEIIRSLSMKRVAI